jgi:hypothetical protein
VVNQLKGFATSGDIEKLSSKLEKLDKSVIGNKTDLKPVVDALNALKRETTLIPQRIPKTEQKDSFKVTNLDEIKLDTSDLKKAIKDLKLDVKVEAPIINTEKTDISPLKDVMMDLLKAINKQKPVVIPEFPKIPETNLENVEKKLDISNKHLKAISEKKTGGASGGGGNGTPYIDSTGKPMNVELTATGEVPVSATALPLPTGAATSANQATLNGYVDQIEGYVDGIEGQMTTLNAKDFATQTTLAALNNKVTAVDTTNLATSAAQTLNTNAVKGLVDIDYTFNRNADASIASIVATDGTKTNTMVFNRNADATIASIASTVT